jgi:hypothetical protein
MNIDESSFVDAIQHINSYKNAEGKQLKDMSQSELDVAIKAMTAAQLNDIIQAGKIVLNAVELSNLHLL